MLELKNSGLPLYFNQTNNTLALSVPLQYDSYVKKSVGQMLGLLANEDGLNYKEEFYDVYRGIRYPEDEELQKKKGLRYDITIVMDGLVNGECKKTSGHYHGYNAQKTNTFAEVYEVIKGKALYILQRADNFESAPHNIVLEDVILVSVEEGQSIIVPPNYGHCSINIGNGPMIFSNLAYVPCPISYDSVKYYHGMGFYIKKDNSKVIVERNERYSHVPLPKFATVKENENLGIKFGLPVYESFKKYPGVFEFLENPDPYVDQIMSMLDYKSCL
jgi:Thermophilic glucose-6-phosphate isomerase and related metalloenzymes